MGMRPRNFGERPLTDAGHKRRWPVGISFIVAVIAAPLVFAACSSSPSSNSSNTSTSSGSSAAIVTTANNPKYGKILVDNEGRTLYTLTNAGKPIPCLGSCTHIWPPLFVPAGNKSLTGGPGVTGLAGTHIVTVQGYPLFRYSGDTAAGEANGNGISSYGGTWYVIKVGTKPGTPVT
jgi:predicted lipoprotein with Yx(FWY)xxD motif